MPEGALSRTWVLKDFSGGINQTASPMDMKENECLEAHNVKFFKPDGCISPRPGRRWMEGVTGTPMANSTSSDVIGIYQHATSAGSTYPMIATYGSAAAPAASAQFGYLDANGRIAGLISASLSPLHYVWTGTGRNTTEWASAFVHYPYSGDHVCMTSYEDHLIATWAPSADYVGAIPPIIWDGITTSATTLHISSEPTLGPEDDGAGWAFIQYDAGTNAEDLVLGDTIQKQGGADWTCVLQYYTYSGTAGAQTGTLYYHTLAVGTPANNEDIEDNNGRSFTAKVNGSPGNTSADRLMSVMIDLSAAYCGTFQGYLFFMNTVENEVLSSNGSGAGLFSAMWHPYRARWNNPAASSIKNVEYSAGGTAWDYGDYVDFDPREGHGITGYGILGDQMLIFKKDKTYEVSWVGGDDVFSYRQVSDKVGCVSHRSVVTTRDGAAWLAEDGFYHYSGDKPKRISDKIQDYVNEINIDRRHLVCGGLWPELKQAWWSTPVGNSQENNRGLICDFHGEDPCWSTASLSLGNLLQFDKLAAGHSAVGIWGTDYNGWAHMYDGSVFIEGSGSQADIDTAGAKVSTGVDYSWSSSFLTFDDLEHIKRIKRVRSVLGRSTTAGHLSVSVGKNWEDSGLPEATSLRPLSGATGVSGNQIYDKCNFTAKGQALNLRYATSAGAAVDGDSVGVSSHRWELHEVGIDYDTLGTLFYGDYA